MQLSIIIPCYNETEEELVRCLNSVNSMDITGGYEVLVIDNNSSEKVALFLKRYCSGRKEFKYLHEPTQGVSAARNRGILESLGTFIAFCDADDYIIKDTVEDFFKNPIEADQILFNQTGNEGNIIPFPAKMEGFVKWQEVAEKKLTMKFPGFYTCLYRTSFLKEHEIQFPVGRRIAEDLYFSFQFWLNKPSIYYINKDFNYVEFNPDSRKNRYLNNPEESMEDLVFERKFKSDFIHQMDITSDRKKQLLLLLDRKLITYLFSELLYLHEVNFDTTEIRKKMRESCGDIDEKTLKDKKSYIELRIIKSDFLILLSVICLARRIYQRWKY